MSWYIPKKGPKSAPGGIRLRKASLSGDTWWSAEWMKAIQSFTKPRALERGLRYATGGHVLSVQVDDGFAEALVQGSRLQPYKVEIGLPMLTPSQAKRVADEAMEKAYFVAKLLAGELPHDIAKIFEEAGLALFPESESDLSSDCSCPDDNLPCKHITAAYYILGQEFDRDPFMLLEMRGLTRAQLLAEIHLRRASTKTEKQKTESPAAPPEFPAQTSLAGNLNDFFDAPKDRPLSLNRPANFLEQLPPAGSRIKELGSPPFWQSDYDFQDILRAIYLTVRKSELPK